MRRKIPIAFGLAFFLSHPLSSVQAADGPRLVVQITVDGLRGDLIDRYMPSFGQNGFRRLTDNGIWYRNAHHLHANTETIVGHATLATGAHPSEHGMIGNVWLDHATMKLVYNIEDPDFPLLPVTELASTGVQLDPAQAVAQAGGRSPRNLLASTFGDELHKSNNGQTKVFGVSGKDRSAVAMAGHVGKAFWMSTSTGAYETSSYYYDAYPDWVADWNSAQPANGLAETDWQLSDPPDSYLLLENDDRPYETDLKGFGRTFPHRFGRPDDGIFYSQVLVSPVGDELTADFAKALIRHEALGADEYPDFLGISFSTIDAINHFFGPSSLENEEAMRRLDRTLADFFDFLDGSVGSQHVLYVLSGDHGMPEMPEFMEARGFTVERNYVEDLQADLNAAIEEAFGVPGAVQHFFRPYIYLDRTAIRASGTIVQEVERLIIDKLMERVGIAAVMPREPLPDQVGGYLERAIKRNYHPRRSGDLYVVQAPYSFLFNKGAVATMHGSPWRYDSHVPIVFSGPGIEPLEVTRRVGTVDVAVTLASYFGVTLPSGASGEVLSEIGR